MSERKKKRPTISLAALLMMPFVMTMAETFLEKMLEDKDKKRRIDALERDLEWFSAELHKATEPKGE